MAAHLTVPRYPYRFMDGTLIRVVGDGVWWQIIQSHLNKQTVRTPIIVGHYRTWPGTQQAEFRHNADHGCRTRCSRCSEAGAGPLTTLATTLGRRCESETACAPITAA
jgi:hypothetical protein